MPIISTDQLETIITQTHRRQRCAQRPPLSIISERFGLQPWQYNLQEQTPADNMLLSSWQHCWLQFSLSRLINTNHHSFDTPPTGHGIALPCAVVNIDGRIAFVTLSYTNIATCSRGLPVLNSCKGVSNTVTWQEQHDTLISHVVTDRPQNSRACPCACQA